MKKLLVSSLVLMSLVSCREKPIENPNLIYDTLSVSKLVDSVIKQIPNLNGNEANKEEAIHKIMYNNFYTIYNNVPLKFIGTSDKGYEVKEGNNKIYYGSYFSNEFRTKDGHKLSLNVNVIIEEKDVKMLMKDSLYVLTGDFSKFENKDFKGSISDSFNSYLGNHDVTFPDVWLKNNGKVLVPFTFKKVINYYPLRVID